jgi:ubiquitin carboxyl-terminal hydrolase 7
VGEQALQGDNAYRTELFGLQDATKGNRAVMEGLKISFLPPVLMLQLKRFQFNPFTEANEKVMDRCSYP